MLAGVAGILLTAPLSLQQAVAPRPAVGWVLTGLGAALAVGCVRSRWTPPQWATTASSLICVVFCIITVALGVSQTAAAVSLDDRQLSCTDDVAPDALIGGQELLHAINPFTHFNVLRAEQQLGCTTYKATPLRSGIFAYAASPPSDEAIQTAAEATLAGHPSGGLLDGFNYPAGTAVTGILGPRGLVIASPLAMLLAGLVAVRRTPPRAQRAFGLALGAQTGALALVGAARPDALVAALLIIACTHRRSWAGGIALGIACATKQTAWFVAPALLALAWREREGNYARFVIGALAGFAVLNLVFIAATPGAWLQAVLGPETSPTFPLGYGPVGAVGTGAGLTLGVGILSSLMFAAVAGGTAICLVAPRSWAPVGVIVASLGLWVGPRSLGYYIALLGGSSPSAPSLHRQCRPQRTDRGAHRTYRVPFVAHDGPTPDGGPGYWATVAGTRFVLCKGTQRRRRSAINSVRQTARLSRKAGW